MLSEWDVTFPGRLQNMACALQNGVPSHLMARGLHPFQTLRATGVADENGDKAIDDEPLLETTTQSPGWDEDSDTPLQAGNEAARRAVIPIAVS
jgi:tRNA 2-thiocytidine biosynthesis protein TtcA